MAIPITCPYCSREYSVKDQEVGKMFLCRGCRKEFVVNDPNKVKGPAQKGSLQAGRASVVLGAVSMFAVMVAYCTLGFSLIGAVPLALAGLGLGFYGKGGLKVAGPILNGLVLVMALFWVMLTVFAPRYQPTPGSEEQEIRTLPGMQKQEIQKLP